MKRGLEADAALLRAGRGHRGIGDKDVGDLDVGVVSFSRRLVVKEEGLFLQGMFAETEGSLVDESRWSKEFSVKHGCRGVP